MAIRIGSLLIRLAVEHGLLQEGLAQSERDVAKTTKAIEKRGREIADFGTNMSLAISLPIAGLAVASVKAAKESADALGQVNAALASMGNASGRTAQQLQELAGAQMRQSLYDDDQILREVTANLLTFGKVSGEQFDRAQQAALDLATRMNGDLKGATIQIGKALNDPVKGITALAKAGIQFTADQKAMIASMVEAGDVAGAQRMILAELEKQFGGSAKAARDADPGAAMAQSFANFQEEIGGKLLPLLPAIADAITGVLDTFSALPAGVQSSIIVIAGLGAAFGPALVGLGGLIQAGAGTIAMFKGVKLALDFGGLIKNLIPMIATLGKAMIGLLANPVLLTAAVVIGGIFLAWQNWDKIKPIIDRVVVAVTGFWNEHVAPVLAALGKALVQAVTWWIDLHIGAIKAVGQLVIGVKTWLQDKLGAIFDWVGKKIEKVTGFFEDMYIAVVGNSYVPDMVSEIGTEFTRLQALMVDPARKATTDVTEATRKMASDVTALLDRLFPEFARARQLKEELALIDGAGLNENVRRSARLRLLNEGQGGATVSEDLLATGPLVTLGDRLDELGLQIGGVAQTAKTQTVQIAQSLKDMADQSIQALDRMVNAFKGGGLLDILGSAVSLFLQLGSTGLFGNKLAANINAPRIPGNANGTAYHPGGLMMVGERGPEILQAPRGSRVVPNHELRAAGEQKIRVILEERTDIVAGRIDGRIAAAAPGIASGGAAIAQARLSRRQSRRIG